MFQTLRALVYLRRIDNSVRRLAEATETLARVAMEQEKQNTQVQVLKPKAMIFGRFSQEEADLEQRRRVQEEL